MVKNIVVIGSSTGGPKLLNEMFKEMPVLDAAVIIVQHVPPKFDHAIAERLNDFSPMEIKLAASGDVLKHGKGFFAPANSHVRIRNNRVIHLVGRDYDKEKLATCCCPSIDVTMRSLNKASSGKIIGVVLTGMGSDGAEGIVHIKALGGITLAQDEASCVVFGMPRAAIATMKVDHVLPGEHMAAMIQKQLASSTNCKHR